MQLTVEQTDLVNCAHDNGPKVIIVNAGPGCAKSTTIGLMAKALPLAQRPSIKAVAFNKEAVADLQAKLPAPAKATTFNSLGLSIWGKCVPEHVQIKLEPNKTRQIIKELQNSDIYSISPEEFDDLIALVNVCKTRGYTPPKTGAIKGTRQPTFKEVCEIADVHQESHYENLVNKALTVSINTAFQGLIDFEDQVYMPTYYGVGFVFPKIKWLFVDEAQDMSPPQLRLVERINAAHTVIVGDPHQAIYAFRGAMNDSFDQIKETFQGADELPLQISFRLPHKVVDLLSKTNPYLTTASPFEGVVYALTSMQTISDLIAPLKGTGAILCRNNGPLFRAALACMASAVPFQMKNTAFTMGLVKDIQRAVRNLRDTDAYELPSIMREFWRHTDLTVQEMDRLLDKVAVLEQLSLQCTTAEALVFRLKDLMRKPNPMDKHKPITLATGHSAKGLEFDWVLHLDPQLIPVQYASTPEQLAQEANIAYVINSRTRHTLLFCESQQLLIPGGARKNRRPDTRRFQPV